MRLKYFTDTDTAYIEFSDSEIVETIEITPNIYRIKQLRQSCCNDY